MEGRSNSWLRHQGQRGPGQEKDDLHRALVAGLMLDVLLESPPGQANPRVRRAEVKARLKSAMVAQLAGHMPLETFRRLTRNLDIWFDRYYPLVAGSDLGATRQLYLAEEQSPYTCQSPRQLRETVGRGLIKEHLDGLQELLPRRRHRKLDQGKLVDFLQETRGEWFRLGDFENYFGMDRKTAWEYVQKLIQAELLVHNQGRSAAVRYRLADRFIVSGQGSGNSGKRC